MRISFEGPSPDAIDTYRRQVRERLERASVRAVAVTARRGRAGVRERMAAAGLGRLGNAVDANADRGAVHRGPDDFSTSARFFVRSRSERTLGTLAAYLQGAEIAPTRGRWLWVPTDSIPRVAKRQRVTPALWRANGLDRTIGPLVLIRSVNGYPLLVVEAVGVDASGKKRSAKALRKSGGARKGQVRKEMLVAFIGVPRTARAARINITSILETARAELPAVLSAELAKETR
ncbi:hypothetical protein [Novosphingobium colocasiae]|uniref:hypothetical protein n=1 Tax=Novosphingobium colocasiae TaxID=1256513 RepID=UPI0035AFA5F7